MIKRIFRYPISDLCMLVSTMVCFAGMFLMVTQINEIDIMDNEKKAYANAYEYKLNFNAVMNRDVVDALGSLDCNVKMDSYQIFVNDLNVTCLAEIVLNAPEKLNYVLESGKYSDKGVYIGKNISSKLKNKDKIEINGYEYAVDGVFGGKSDFLADKIVIFLNSLNEAEQKNILNLNFYNLTLFSNVHMIDDSIQTIKNLNPDIEIVENNDVTVATGNKTESTLYALLYAFALINSLIIAKYWIYERKYEIYIKKSYNISLADLLLYYFRELMLVSLPGVLLEFIFFGGWNLSIPYLCMVVIGISITVLLILLLSLTKEYFKTAALIIKQECD